MNHYVFEGTQNHVFSMYQKDIVATCGIYTRPCIKEFFGCILSIIFKNWSSSVAIITSTGH